VHESFIYYEGLCSLAHLISLLSPPPSFSPSKGDDEGRVYGKLISEAGKESSASPAAKRLASKDSNSSRSGRKRRRRRRQKRVAPVGLPEPHPQVAAIHGDKKEEEEEEAVAGVTCGSLHLLAAYSGSSDTDSDSCRKRLPGELKGEDPLPIPSAIHDMFQPEAGGTSCKELHHPEEEKESFWESPGVGSLGYFEADDSSSSCDDSHMVAGSSQISESLARKNQKLSSTESHSNMLLEGHLQSDGEKFGADPPLGDSGLSLTSYTCWKCSNVGHLPQDCTVRVSTSAGGRGTKVKVPKTLQVLYASCREIRIKKGQRCSDCGIRSNLACCLDCRYVMMLAHGGGYMGRNFNVSHLVVCGEGWQW
jgi:hypothetical protein